MIHLGPPQRVQHCGAFSYPLSHTKYSSFSPLVSHLTGARPPTPHARAGTIAEHGHGRTFVWEAERWLGRVGESRMASMGRNLIGEVFPSKSTGVHSRWTSPNEHKRIYLFSLPFVSFLLRPGQDRIERRGFVLARNSARFSLVSYSLFALGYFLSIGRSGWGWGGSNNAEKRPDLPSATSRIPILPSIIVYYSSVVIVTWQLLAPGSLPESLIVQWWRGA
ncbi:hypothetical protein L209DRAFT_137236 [Thermothelomyces heterothallicus CBS 203.75]